LPRTGALLGYVVGALVAYFRLPSLIATLGMSFVLRGMIQIVTEGKSIALVSLTRSEDRRRQSHVGAYLGSF
jgi:ribose/xylose/arabinose/galactoside ABC-type transport system permease subunit